MKLLICKDTKNNKLISSSNLSETDNIKYSIIEDAPVIENREGYTGKYVLDEDGNIVVEYEEIPLTESEQLEKRMCQLQEMLAEISMNGMGE